MNNPLLSPYALPPLDRIRPEHFLPALDARLAGAVAAAAAVKAAPPGFDTTVIPLSRLFDGAGRVTSILGSYAMGAYTPEIGRIQQEADEKLDAASKTIFQDADLGARFKAVWDARETLNLDADDTALLRDMHDAFEDSGALLPPEGQQRLREIDARLIGLARQFTDTLLAAAEQQAVLVTDAAELAGLGAGEIAGFAEAAKAKGHTKGWLIVPERLMVGELLERAENPGFRRKIFEALDRMGTEAPHDNRPALREMQSLRHEAATLLGYPSYADYARQDGLVPGLAATRALLDDVTALLLPKFESDMRALEAFAGQKLEPWDVPFHAVRQKQALFGFDANAFASYLPLESVLGGLFSEAEFLHGLKFSEVKDQPVLHPDVRAFAAHDAATGALRGYLHLDVFARPGEKEGGAWMESLQSAEDGLLPVVKFNMNVQKPSGSAPALVSLSQTETAYHEMGHCLHGLVGTHVKHPSLQGTAGGADFVEIHSTVNEYRSFLKENLAAHARHAQTGLPPDAAEVGRLNAAKAHFLPALTLLVVQNSLRDLAFHSVKPQDYADDKALEASVRIDSPYADHLRPYGLARFTHLFDSPRGGYAAAYVDYLIAQVYAADAFEPFEKDPYDAGAAKKLAAFYRRGSGGDAAELYKEYRGRPATPAALMREMGISGTP